MADFHLVFCDPKNKDDEFHVPFEVTGTDVSWRWYDLLYKTIRQGTTIGNDRFNGWGVSLEKQQVCCDALNTCIDIVQEYRSNIFVGMKAHVEMSQGVLNDMHKIFVECTGSMDSPDAFYVDAPDEYLYNIDEINVLIHKLEAMRGSQHNRKNANFNFASDHIELLQYDDLQHFELRIRPNTIYLDYYARGKSIVDVFRTGDELDEMVRHTKLGPDFKLRIHGWSDDEAEDFRMKYDKWFAENSDDLIKLNYARNDVTNTAGWLPLATSKIDFVDDIDERLFLKNIRF